MMVTAPTAPMSVRTEKSLPSTGVMFTSDLQELEARLPGQVFNAWEAISRQMETEIYKPILQAPGNLQLKAQFTSQFKRYSDFYISLSFLLASQVSDPAAFVAIWTQVATRLKEELGSRGSEIIGEEATDDMLVGLAAVDLVNKKLIKLAQASSEVVNLQELLRWSTAYSLASSCVYYYYFSRKGNPKNVPPWPISLPNIRSLSGLWLVLPER